MSSDNDDDFPIGRVCYGLYAGGILNGLELPKCIGERCTGFLTCRIEHLRALKEYDALMKEDKKRWWW